MAGTEIQIPADEPCAAIELGEVNVGNVSIDNAALATAICDELEPKFDGVVAAVQQQTVDLTAVINGLPASICTELEPKLQAVVDAVNNIQVSADNETYCTIVCTPFDDDVNGDMTNIVCYIEACLQEINKTTGDITVTDLGAFEDSKLDTPYTPNNPIDPTTLQDNKVIGSTPYYRTLTGPTSFTVAPLNAGYVQSLTIIGITGTTEILDASGVTSTLPAGASVSSEGNTNFLLQPLPTITLAAGATAFVLWEEPLTQ